MIIVVGQIWQGEKAQASCALVLLAQQKLRVFWTPGDTATGAMSQCDLLLRFVSSLISVLLCVCSKGFKKWGNLPSCTACPCQNENGLQAFGRKEILSDESCSRKGLAPNPEAKRRCLPLGFSCTHLVVCWCWRDGRVR